MAGFPTEPNRAIYESAYGHENLQIDSSPDRHAAGMIRLRLRYLDEYAGGQRVADLGCGTGAYLVPAARIAREVIGVDFSARFLAICQSRMRVAGVDNGRLILAALRKLPLADRSVDLAYSYATLYYVPDVERAISETARVLRDGGRAIIELGNVRSLNTLVARAVGGLAGYFLTPLAMLRMLRQNRLVVEEHRKFQLLPMWGGPWYLRPLVTGHWRKVMGVTVGGHMIDERIASLPIARQFAFRHVFVCVKPPS